MKYNAWCGVSTDFLDWYKDNKDQYRQLEMMHDAEVVRGLFKTFTAGGKTYKLFSIYVDEAKDARDLFDKLQANYPQDFAIVGVWKTDTGLQGGTNYDEDGETVIGTPSYPIHAQAWRFMPDTYTGDPPVAVSATSNASLRDVNLLVGQEQRRFV